MGKRNFTYIAPLNNLDAAQEVLKIISMGGTTLGFRLRRDICYALGLKRGMLLKVTVEKMPNSIIYLEEDTPKATLMSATNDESL